MNEGANSSVHWSFWIIAGLTLAWNLMGVASYMTEVNSEAVARLPEAHRTLIEQRPAWATGAFAIAVFGGALGCVLLLLRKSLAVYFFVASLAGVVVQMTYNLFLAESAVEYGPGTVSMIILIPLVAAFLIWYAKTAEKRGWIY
jgi:hypothetical protein